MQLNIKDRLEATKENVKGALSDVFNALVDVEEKAKETFTKENIKAAFTKENVKGAAKGVFNTLALRKGGCAALGGYGAVVSTTAVALAVTSLIVTGGIAAPLIVVGINVTTGALNIHNSRYYAKKHDQKKALAL